MPRIHFAVGSENGPRSSIWEIEADGNDVYIAALGLRYKLKTSLHASGKWRFGVSREFRDELEEAGVWPGGDRKLEGWNRPPEFHLAYTLAFRIVFPASELRVWPIQQLDPEYGSVTWLPTPPAGHAIEVDILYTRPFVEIDSQTGKRQAQVEMDHAWPGQTTMGTQLLSRLLLPSGEALWVVYWVVEMGEGLLAGIESGCLAILNQRPRFLFPSRQVDLSSSSVRIHLGGDEGDGSHYEIEIAGDTLLRHHKAIP